MEKTFENEQPAQVSSACIPLFAADSPMFCSSNLHVGWDNIGKHQAVISSLSIGYVMLYSRFSAVNHG